jgi:hypothetical protein
VDSPGASAEMSALRRAVVNGARALAGEATSEEASYFGGRGGAARGGVGRSIGRRHVEVDGKVSPGVSTVCL